MYKVCLSALAGLALLCPALAHADTIQNYALNATMSNGTKATGSINFDETTGLFSSGTVYASINGANYVFSKFGGSATYDTVTFGNFYDTANDIFQLIIPGISDINYKGGNICSSTVNAGCAVTNGSGAVYVTSTSLTTGANTFVTSGTLAATPEPSSLLLLGTGLVGVFGAARRRFAA